MKKWILLILVILALLTTCVMGLIYKEISLEKIVHFIYSRDVGLELIKAAITSIFGYITFRIYQRYKNKKDNSQLYVQIKKLEIELVENISKFNYAIVTYEEYNSLKVKFSNQKIIQFYEKVDLLNDYKFLEETKNEYGDTIDVDFCYYEEPLRLINELSYYISQLEYENSDIDEDELSELKYQLEKYEKSSIFRDLSELEENLEELIKIKSQFKEPLCFCYGKLKEFNLMKTEEKSNKLNSFCINLLDKENEFLKTLELYKRLRYLELKLSIKNKKKPTKVISLNFELWNKFEFSLLATYDIKTYLKLDDLYHYYDKLEIAIGEEEVIKKTYDDLNSKIVPLIFDIEKRLKVTLDKTNWLFKNI